MPFCFGRRIPTVFVGAEIATVNAVIAIICGDVTVVAVAAVVATAVVVADADAPDNIDDTDKKHQSLLPLNTSEPNHTTEHNSRRIALYVLCLAPTQFAQYPMMTQRKVSPCRLAIIPEATIVSAVCDFIHHHFVFALPFPLSRCREVFNKGAYQFAIYDHNAAS